MCEEPKNTIVRIGRSPGVIHLSDPIFLLFKYVGKQMLSIIVVKRWKIPKPKKLSKNPKSKVVSIFSMYLLNLKIHKATQLQETILEFQLKKSDY